MKIAITKFLSDFAVRFIAYIYPWVYQDYVCELYTNQEEKKNEEI